VLLVRLNLISHFQSSATKPNSVYNLCKLLLLYGIESLRCVWHTVIIKIKNRTSCLLLNFDSGVGTTCTWQSIHFKSWQHLADVFVGLVDNNALLIYTHSRNPNKHIQVNVFQIINTFYLSAWLSPFLLTVLSCCQKLTIKVIFMWNYQKLIDALVLHSAS